MTSVGTGVGGNVGGPAVPLQRDIETTAWTEINKAALGLLADSIEKAFSEINPRYSTGYLGGFGYKSTAENPLLDHPLESLRLAQSFNQATDETWQLAYQDLVNQLPLDLLTRFILDGNKPFEQRNPSFVALDNLLLVTARILTQTQNLSQTMGVNSLEEARTALNILLPFAALKGSIAIGTEVMLAANNFLLSQGANYRHFDGFNNLLGQLQGAVSLMDRVNNSLNNTINGQLSPQAIHLASKAANQLAAISSQLQRISLGNDLQLLLSTITSLQIVATSLALPETRTAPLFLALSISSIGLYTSQSPLGMIGPNLEKLINNLSLGLVTGLMPVNNKAGNELFSLMVTSSLVALVGLASLTVDSGLGIYPRRDAFGINAAHFFAFEAALQLAVSSRFIDIFYQEAIAVSGGNAEAQIRGSTVLGQVAVLLMVLSGSSAAHQSPLRLLENLSNYLSLGIKAAGDIERNAESDQTVATAIALKLCSIALESNDYEGFLDAFNTFLENLGISQDALKADIAKINSVAGGIAGLNAENLDSHLTGITHIV